MKNLYSKTVTVLVALLLASAAAQAANISGTITSTIFLAGENQLTGNVNCQVPGGAPCIEFTADNTELYLNGFVISGDNTSTSACTSLVNGQTAIFTGGYNNTKVEGPGVITQFTGDGVVLTASNSEVDHVVITYVCRSGVSVHGENNRVNENSISGFSLPSQQNFGIFLQGNGNQIQQNAITGGGPFGWGIDIVAPSENNTIQQNNVSGNAAGIVVFGIGGNVSNVIQDNQAIGNFLDDIFDANSAHSNTYYGNLCQISGGAGAPKCPALPAGLIGNPIALPQDQNSQN